MFAWKYVVQAVTDPLVWGYAFLFHGYAFALYSLSLFLVRGLLAVVVQVTLVAEKYWSLCKPTIIAGLGFASWQAQL